MATKGELGSGTIGATMRSNVIAPNLLGGDEMTSYVDPVTGGIVISSNGKNHSGILHPTGNDDAAKIEQFVDDMAASGLEAELGPGDFVVGSPMTWRSKKVLAKWGNKGVGLRVRGKGVCNTRLLWASQSNTDAMLTINAPTAEGIGNRNYLTEIGGMSIVRAPGGVEIAAGSTSGVGIMGTPSAAGDVLHTSRFIDIFLDGFDYPATLSDSTLCEFDTVWWCEFLVALRLGYNVDICKIKHSMFGSEQFGTNYRNNSIAIKTGYNDGFNAPGGENNVEVEHTWFMKIGKAFEGASVLSLKGVRFNKCYFEDVRRYLHILYSTNQNAIVEFNGNHFSHPTTNDTTQNDPSIANYEAKIQFDGDISVTGGITPILSMRDNTSDLIGPANAWVSFNARNGRILFENNQLSPSASYGHIRCIRTGYQTWRSIPNNALGLFSFGDTNIAGVGKMAGDPIEVSATISAGATYSINTQSGDVFYLTLPDGDCTIDVQNYSATPPSHIVGTLTKAKLILIVPAAVTATRTITWGARMKMNSATLTYSAANQNQRSVIALEGYSNTGNGLQLASAAPSFVS